MHLSLPDDVMVSIETKKLSCNDCGRNYYPEDIVKESQNIYIEAFAPEDGHCFDCGSRDIVRSGNAAKFEKELVEYRKQKDEMLGFYD